MFEEDHPQSPSDAAPQKKRVGTAVMLAAGGVVVATLFATVASMLAASGHEANPEHTSADVVQTITSVAPDGSTSTVSSSAPKSSAAPDRKQAARPNEQPKPGAPQQQPQLTTNPTEPSQTQSNPPTSWTEPPATSTSSSTSSTTTPPSSSSSSSAPAPKP